MSIQKMISEHPDVEGHLNDPLAEVVYHANVAGAILASCADACLAEDMDMTQCIRTCLDGSDAALALARIGARRSGSNEATIKAVLSSTKTAIQACHAECKKHDNPHCKRCATMCEELIADIEKAEL